MEKQTTGTLTEGPIFKVLTKLALPIMASSFLSTAYNIIDMAWIGMLGAKAVAGVGAGGMYVWLSQGLATLARMGGQVHVAQCMGRGEEKEAGNYAQAAIQMVLLFGVVFGILCVAGADALVGFFGIDDEVTVRYAVQYLKITCGLVVFSYINFTLTGLFTAQGDSKTPLKANTIGLAANMIFDPLLIFGVGPFPRMEIVGAAVATVGAQIVVTVILVTDVVRARQQGNILRNIHIFENSGTEYYGKVFRMGFPMAIQSSLYCMISMVLTRMVAGFGSGAVATQRVGGQIESVSWNTADGFAAALNAFVGQNYGAGKTERIKKGYRISFLTMSVWGLLITALFVFRPEFVAGLFFHEADVIAVAVRYLIIVGLSEAFMCVELMSIGAISGFGSTKLCSIISVLLTGCRIPLAIVLTKTALGLEGIWWALTITSVLKGIVFYFVFHFECGKRKASVRMDV